MSLIAGIREVLRQHPQGLSPADIVQIMKREMPELYDLPRHRESLAKGTVTSLDHALKADIYFTYPRIEGVEADKTVRPMRLFLVDTSDPGPQPARKTIVADITQEPEVPPMSAETITKLEAGVGTLYVLATQTYTREGAQILKIGITAGSVDQRIRQLYTTGTSMPFEVVLQVETPNYGELEKALHQLLAPFRINRDREFFSDRCLPFVEAILKVHHEIQTASKLE